MYKIFSEMKFYSHFAVLSGVAVEVVLKVR